MNCRTIRPWPWRSLPQIRGRLRDNRDSSNSMSNSTALPFTSLDGPELTSYQIDINELAGQRAVPTSYRGVPSVR